MMSSLISGEYPPILVAEDEESDVVLLQVAMKESQVPNALFVVRDGQQIVDYLLGSAPFEDRATFPLPGLLLLDLKMPRMTGLDVLRWLAAHPHFRWLPAVMLSSSAQATDLEQARELGAREYIVKPTSFTELAGCLRGLAERWVGQGTREKA
jgi:CheY-like chemotaxis protein